MLDFKISVKPAFEEIGKAFKNVSLKEILRQVNEEIAFAIERYSKQVTPVRTGRLRASINVSSAFGNQIESFVAPHTEYAGYVHKRKPFMQWGTEFAMQKFSGVDIGWKLDKELRKQLSGTGLKGTIYK